MRPTLLLALAGCTAGPGILPPTPAQDCEEAVKVTVYTDADGDGAGDDNKTLRACALVDGTVLKGGDCDDGDASLNLQDADGDGYSTCDGDCDDSNSGLHLDDLDGDGFDGCSGDCDDDDPLVGPFDEDGDGYTMCDGDCDDTDPLLSGADADGDGWTTCDLDCDDSDGALNLDDADGDGVSTCDGDCDDLDASVSPAVIDTCEDGVDQDCDGADDPCRLEFEMAANAPTSGTTHNGSQYFRGHAFYTSAPVTLIDFGWYLGLSAPCDLDFYVHQSASGMGPWTVLYSGTVSASTTDMHLSPPINLLLPAGSYHGVGVGWNCSASYYSENGAFAGPWPLGLFEWTYWDNSYPGYGPSYSPPSTGGAGGGTAYNMTVGYQ